MSRSWHILLTGLGSLITDPVLAQPLRNTAPLAPEAGRPAATVPGDPMALCKNPFDRAKTLATTNESLDEAIRIYRKIYYTSQCYKEIPSTVNALVGISKASLQQGRPELALVYYHWYLDMLAKRRLEFPAKLSNYRQQIQESFGRLLVQHPASTRAGSTLRQLQGCVEGSREPAALLALSQSFCEELGDAEVSLALREYHDDVLGQLSLTGPPLPPLCRQRVDPQTAWKEPDSGAPGSVGNRPPASPLYKRWWFWTLLGLGSAGSALAIGLSVHAASQSIPAPYATAPIIVF